MKKLFKENKKVCKMRGITLVAMIVTLIILMILAGIAIATLKNTKLFENSKIAKEKYTNLQNDENAIIDDYTNQIENYKVIESGRDITKNNYDLIYKRESITNTYIYTFTENYEECIALTVSVYESEDGNSPNAQITFSGNNCKLLESMQNVEGTSNSNIFAYATTNLYRINNVKAGDTITFSPCYRGSISILHVR